MHNNLLGLRIRQLREEKKLKQINLAKHLSISNTTLSQYESGKRIPGDEIKIKIAKFFDVSIDYLLGCTDVRNPNEQKEPDCNVKSRLYDNLTGSGLPEDDIKKVEEYIELLKYKCKLDGLLNK
ncbi:MAG: helix-turn-helix domain-containing protein [Clostridia bacterium]|nr:helix-turn-helix transcriptional regulator [Clostridiales bacterium]